MRKIKDLPNKSWKIALHEVDHPQIQKYTQYTEVSRYNNPTWKELDPFVFEATLRIKSIGGNTAILEDVDERIHFPCKTSDLDKIFKELQKGRLTADPNGNITGQFQFTKIGTALSVRPYIS